MLEHTLAITLGFSMSRLVPLKVTPFMQALIDPAAVAAAEVPGVEAAIGANAVRPIVEATVVSTAGVSVSPSFCHRTPIERTAMYRSMPNST